MVRTPRSTLRRRSLASAACGRTAVALYLCLSPGSDAVAPLSDLRRYANARDWTVVLEAVDWEPGERLQNRAQWPRLAEAFSRGIAQGLVAYSPGMWHSDADDEFLMRDWFADRHAFVTAAYKGRVDAGVVTS